MNVNRMVASLQTVVKIATVATLLAMGTLIVPEGTVSACSCDLAFPTIADSIGGAEVAFVGRLDSTEEIDPSQLEGDYEYFDVRYELIVEHAVKGVENGDRVVMFGDINVGSSCGTSELEPGQERYAILSDDRSGRFIADSTPPCTRMPSVGELLDADLTLPETSPGPVDFVVVGRLGEAELISFAADGHPVAYGDLPVRAGRPAVCPGGERLVQLEHGWDEDHPVLTIRSLASLEVIDHIEVSDAALSDADVESFLVHGAELDCRSPDGYDVSAVLTWENTADGETVSVLIRPDEAGGVQVAFHGRLSRAVPDPSSDDFVGVRDGAFIRVDPSDSLDEHVIAHLAEGPAEAGFDALFVKSDGVDRWWIGFGGAEDDLADRLEVLILVNADGETERWSVDDAPDNFYSVVLTDGVLVDVGHGIPLPEPGSSATVASVVAVPREGYGYDVELGDGRSLRYVFDETASEADWFASGEQPTLLRSLFDVRSAIAVEDGPAVDSSSIRREPIPYRVDSPWITPNGLAAIDREPVEATEVSPSTSSSSTATDGADAVVSETPTSEAARSSSSESGRGPIVAAVVLVALAAIAAVVIRRRWP